MPMNLQVFILGPARSGTSITYFAMREVFDLPGAGESHVIPIFARIIHSFYTHLESFRDTQTDVLARSLDTADFRRHVLQYIRDFYQSVYLADRWVDKTPGDEAIFGALLIRQAFPSAKLICTKRSGVEVVESFRVKFSSSFETACHAWAGAMNALLAMREISPGILEVDQFDIANSPGMVAQQIADHLGMPERKNALTAFFRDKRTDQLSSHDWRQRLTTVDAGWTDEERGTFLRLCGELMHKFGYPI
jgi:hypothetical protein